MAVSSLTLGIAAGSIPRDDFGAGMGFQPRRKGRALAIRQQIDDIVGFKIDEDGPVPLTTSPGPVIDTQNARCLPDRKRICTNDPKHGIRARAHAQSCRQACTGFPSQGQPHASLDVMQTGRAAAVGPDRSLRALGKNAPVAPPIGATKATDLKANVQRHSELTPFRHEELTPMPIVQLMSTLRTVELPQ